MTNVHVVGFIGEQIVVCQDDRGVWILPGGTREEGESIEDCAVRELSEEAGARLAGLLQPIGAHRCVTDRPAPHRPYQPYPESAWLWCSADVVLDSAPTNPAGQEQVLQVCAVDKAQAQGPLLTDAVWLPELVALAVEMRSAQLRLRRRFSRRPVPRSCTGRRPRSARRMYIMRQVDRRLRPARILDLFLQLWGLSK